MFSEFAHGAGIFEEHRRQRQKNPAIPRSPNPTAARRSAIRLSSCVSRSMHSRITRPSSTLAACAAPGRSSQLSSGASVRIFLSRSICMRLLRAMVWIHAIGFPADAYPGALRKICPKPSCTFLSSERELAHTAPQTLRRSVPGRSRRSACPDPVDPRFAFPAQLPSSRSAPFALFPFRQDNAQAARFIAPF